MKAWFSAIDLNTRRGMKGFQSYVKTSCHSGNQEYSKYYNFKPPLLRIALHRRESAKLLITTFINDHFRVQDTWLRVMSITCPRSNRGISIMTIIVFKTSIPSYSSSFEFPGLRKFNELLLYVSLSITYVIIKFWDHVKSVSFYGQLGICGTTAFFNLSISLSQLVIKPPSEEIFFRIVAANNLSWEDKFWPEGLRLPKYSQIKKFPMRYHYTTIDNTFITTF